MIIHVKFHFYHFILHMKNINFIIVISFWSFLSACFRYWFHKYFIHKLAKANKNSNPSILMVQFEFFVLMGSVWLKDYTFFCISASFWFNSFWNNGFKYDSEITEWITGNCTERHYDTRNHRFALQQSHIHYDIRKFSFSNRIIPLYIYGIVHQIT